MKVQKITVDITIEVLSPDAVAAVLIEVAEAYRRENEGGAITKDDGDCALWATTRDSVKEI